MLKGLDVSEVKFCKLNTFETFRYDAEYFQKQYIIDETLTSKRADDFCKFKNYSIEIDCSAFYPSLEPYYNTGDVPFIRVGDVKTWIDYDNCIRLPQDISHKFPTLKSVGPGDIVITKGGSIGRVGFVLEPAYVSRDILFLKSSVLPREQEVLLFFYLTSNFANRGLLRSSSQIAQPHITVSLIKNFDILRLDLSMSDKLTEIFDTCLDLIKESAQKYHEAEQTLLGELGFAGWSPTQESFSIKNCSDFFAASRFDAEYFHPKYDELFALLDKCKTRSLGGKAGLVDIQRSIEPGSDAYSDKGVPFVRIADFTEMGITTPEIHIPPEICADSPRPKKDTILLSKDGSVGIAYKVEDDLDVVTSSGILHLTVKDTAVLPDYLTLVLNSKIVRLQAERDAGGSIIQHWKQTEIERVKIPLLPLPRQRVIADKVQSSFALRAESKRLLDLAKHAVETAIEQGEQKAMTVLNTGN